MPDEVLMVKDTPEIGMPRERNPHEVIDLALLELHAREHGRCRGNNRRIVRQRHLHRQPVHMHG